MEWMARSKSCAYVANKRKFYKGGESLRQTGLDATEEYKENRDAIVHSISLMWTEQ